MIYKTKVDLAKSLGIHRVTVDGLLKRGEVKVIYDNKGKKLGYVLIINLIKDLVNN